MGKVEVKIHMSGVREVFNAPGVQADLRRRAEAIASAANSGAASHGPFQYTSLEPYHVVDVTTRKVGTHTVAVGSDKSVHTGSKKNPGPAIGDVLQARYSVLTQALDAGRG